VLISGTGFTVLHIPSYRTEERDHHFNNFMKDRMKGGLSAHGRGLFLPNSETGDDAHHGAEQQRSDGEWTPTMRRGA